MRPETALSVEAGIGSDFDCVVEWRLGEGRDATSSRRAPGETDRIIEMWGPSIEAGRHPGTHSIAAV
jgi:hypothetical protein